MMVEQLAILTTSSVVVSAILILTNIVLYVLTIMFISLVSGYSIRQFPHQKYFHIMIDFTNIYRETTTTLFGSDEVFLIRSLKSQHSMQQKAAKRLLKPSGRSGCKVRKIYNRRRQVDCLNHFAIRAVKFILQFVCIHINVINFKVSLSVQLSQPNCSINLNKTYNGHLLRMNEEGYRSRKPTYTRPKPRSKVS